MSNHLSNGTVLPHGLLGVSSGRSMAAFNKAYKNTALRMGIVITIYPVSDPNNYSGLSTEYDVLVLEQNENVSCTNMVYRNCLSSEGMGSIADFFEKNLRKKQTQSLGTEEINTSDQNGAVVLLLCLDGITQKGIVIGGLTNPGRDTTLTTDQPYLQGEYNGVNVVVNTDGSTALTFKGATDNNGDPIDSSQGNTEVQIMTDGSFQIQHSTITMTLARSGDVTLTGTGNNNITVGGTLNITVTGPANIIAQGLTTIDGSNIKLGQTAIESVIKGDTFRDIYNAHTHIGNLGYPTGVPNEPMDPSLSTHVYTE